MLHEAYGLRPLKKEFTMFHVLMITIMLAGCAFITIALNQ